MSLLPHRNPVDVEFIDVTYDVPGKAGKDTKIILKNICGKFLPGKLTAIMGPSGAGKTTLMHVCAGFKTNNVKGTFLTNGVERKVNKFRKESCYIMQDDDHLPHLTVEEAMNVSANLKIDGMTSETTKRELIREILETLGLSDCLNTRTSNLSGGQRKRLSIAVELINNPPVMFFDEPTSGLDSENSYQCIKLLRSLAKEGRTIICTIHQPSSRLFQMFDSLYALSEGQCIYTGSVTGLLPYLSSMEFNCPSYHNPADFLIEVAASGNCSDVLASAVEGGKCNSDGGMNEKTTHNNEILKSNDQEMSVFLAKHETKLAVEKEVQDDIVFSTPASLQIFTLLKRNYLSIMRDSMLTQLRLMSHIVVGVLLGILYLGIGNEASKIGDNSGLLFCCVLFTIFAGMMPTILTFPLEMKVFVREHHNYWYSVKSYYTAKTLADVPFQIIYPILFVVIVYFMTNQPHEWSRFWMFTAMCILTSLVAQSLALVIGIVMDIQAATFCAPIVSIPVLMFSGFFVTKSTIPFYVRWFVYLSYMKYGYEGAMVSIYDFERDYLECSVPYCRYREPSKFLEFRDIDLGTYWVNFGALCGFALGLRILGFFALKWKLKQER